MAKEIERKFLVKGDFIQRATGNISIVQRYLAKDNDKSVRLRIANDKAFITIKSKLDSRSISRNEWEFPIPLTDAGEMMDICLPGKIIKTRFLVPSGKHTIEVDVFHGKNEGLIIAEIELSDENEYFEKPEWLGEEVTGRAEYYNVNLIK